jgi:8-oxo-dGTP pyrophosphatase MutT (NUDIX family)
MKKQFTATIYILKDDKVLLIHHRKHQKWLPPGGHLMPNEIPIDGAIREAKEETGLDVMPLRQENVWIEGQENARSIERPYLCLLENIPSTPSEPAHQHIDFIFVGTPIGGIEMENIEEITKMKWFTLEEVENLRIGVDIFPDTVKAIRQIFSESVFLADTLVKEI